MVRYGVISYDCSPFLIFQCFLFRVLNVLRHWVDQHFYDFQREHGAQLLGTLEKFLSGINRNKTAKKWVDTIEKIVRRRVSTLESVCCPFMS